MKAPAKTVGRPAEAKLGEIAANTGPMEDPTTSMLTCGDQEMHAMPEDHSRRPRDGSFDKSDETLKGSATIISSFRNMAEKREEKFEAVHRFTDALSKQGYIDKTLLRLNLERQVTREHMNRELLVFCLFLLALLGFRDTQNEFGTSIFEAGSNVREALVDAPWAKDGRAFEQIGQVEEINEWLQEVVARELFISGPIVNDTGGYIGVKALRRISPVVLRVQREANAECQKASTALPLTEGYSYRCHEDYSEITRATSPYGGDNGSRFNWTDNSGTRTVDDQLWLDPMQGRWFFSSLGPGGYAVALPEPAVKDNPEPTVAFMKQVPYNDRISLGKVVALAVKSVL